MAAAKNSGTCLRCKEKVEHRFIIKHITHCLEKEVLEDTPEKENVFLIKIAAGNLFWLYLEMNSSATLEKLDSFLRDTWLECCGHMSQFSIHGNDYSSNGGMNKPLCRLFEVGTKFDYQYDFGSTTELEGKIISSRPSKLKEGVRLVARNNLPDVLQCSLCKKYPEVICSVCYDFFCKKCKNKHRGCEGQEFLLPVVNSPRMGVCGYTGPD